MIDLILKLFNKGWIIVNCSCMCGGSLAWMKPRPSGAYEMVGCICHNGINPPQKLLPISKVK
jgi:hypothetical protein